MPCVTVHMLAAREVAGQWRRRPDEAPVDLRKRSALRAFYHGALAPDMGFAPGVERFVSDLAHHISPGDLVRRLVARSRDTVERAFAWGWATHVVADAEFHPLVGQAMGEQILGDRGVRMNTHEAPESHVSIEVGLDTAVLAGHPDVPTPPYRPLRLRQFEPLSAALEEVFSLRWSARELHGVHRRTTRLFSLWPLGLRVLLRGSPSLGGSVESQEGGIVGRGMALLLARTQEGSSVSGYLNASAPPEWLLRTVLDRIGKYPHRFRELAREGLESLGNPSLETGGPAGAGQGHPVADRVAAKLALRRRTAVDGAVAPLGAGGAGAPA